MNAGIISSLKRSYLNLKYKRVLDSIDGEDNIYNIDQLTEMSYVQSTWRYIPAEIISNCCKSCDSSGSEAVECGDGDTFVALGASSLYSFLNNLPNIQRRMSIINF